MFGRITGIDPGKTGAACCMAFDDRRFHVFDMIDLPIIDDRLNAESFAEWLRTTKSVRIVIENVRIRPIPSKTGGKPMFHGANSMTTFIRIAGACEAVAATLYGNDSILLAEPSVWKRQAGLIGGEKDDSRLLALKLVPAAAHFLRLKKSHNKAEALLLAIYGAELLRRERAA